jgi:hypothetical protein
MITRVLPQAFTGPLGHKHFWVADVAASQTPLALAAVGKLEDRPSLILKRVMKADQPGVTSVLACHENTCTREAVTQALLSQGVEMPFEVRLVELIDHVPAMEVRSHHAGG